MKKFFAILLAALMLLSVTACSKTETPAPEAENDAVETPEVSNDIIPELEEGSFGATMWELFASAVAENADATAEELVNTISGSDKIPYQMMPAPLNPEYIPGFDEGYAPAGYTDGATFGPMIGSIPFIGYVFRMEEGTDLAAFVQELTDNCNPRWNICVEADQTVAGAIGDLVFFVMCPLSAE